MIELEFWPLMVILGLFALNILVPGANFVWISRMSLDHGRSSGWHASLGATFGDMVYAFAALAGLSALLAGEPMALPLLGLIGGLWLVYSGTRMLLLPATIALEREEALDHKPWPFFKAFKSGLLVNLTNPQSLLFFSTILMSGLPSGPSLPQASLLCSGVLAISLLFRGGIAVLFASAPVRVAYARIKRPINIASGTALMAFGFKTAWQAIPFWAAYAKPILPWLAV